VGVFACKGLYVGICSSVNPVLVQFGCRSGAVGCSLVQLEKLYWCDQLVDFLSNFTLHARDQMPVYIEGDGGPGMPQPPGNRDDRDILIEKKRGCCMAQIVKADRGETSIFEQLLEIPKKVAGVDWPTSRTHQSGCESFFSHT
jgi:hypothetical protein